MFTVFKWRRIFLKIIFGDFWFLPDYKLFLSKFSSIKASISFDWYTISLFNISQWDPQSTLDYI